jgi:chromosome segregation ATPase
MNASATSTGGARYADVAPGEPRDVDAGARPARGERAEIERALASLRASHDALKGEHGRLGEERQEAERTLVSLRASHETGVRERERLARELAEVQERHDAAMRERHRAGEELEAILRRFRTSA